jgi:hypothetical protein
MSNVIMPIVILTIVITLRVILHSIMPIVIMTIVITLRVILLGVIMPYVLCLGFA